MASGRDESQAYSSSVAYWLACQGHVHGSHRVLKRPDWPMWCLPHDHEEIGPRMLARLAAYGTDSLKICNRHSCVAECILKYLHRRANLRERSFSQGVLNLSPTAFHGSSYLWLLRLKRL
jgi:hypothetical protein